MAPSCHHRSPSSKPIAQQPPDTVKHMMGQIPATTAMATAGVGEKTRLIVPHLPLTKRIKYALVAWLWIRLLLKPMLYYSEIRRYFARYDRDPDLIKTYPVRKSLKIRIFFPPSHNPSTGSPNPTKLPTLLTIHGGGFTVGEPNDNDKWNRSFSKRHSFLVIALDYAKAPSSPFPTAIHDIEALIGCILSDTSLPIDPNRVAIAGWSAGGNLALAASQLPSLRDKIRAVVPLYPLVDFATGTETKAKGRRYKPALGGFRGRDSDFLLLMMGLFNWAYLTPGQRCDDPLLSPIYASRGDLPKNIFLIACELDILALEAWRMVCKLAGKRVPGVEEMVGCEETVGRGRLITEGDERFCWEERMENGGRVRWLLVPDTIHGFDQENIEGMANDAVFAQDARVKTTRVMDLIGDWLVNGPLGEDEE